MQSGPDACNRRELASTFTTYTVCFLSRPTGTGMAVKMYSRIFHWDSLKLSMAKPRTGHGYLVCVYDVVYGMC